MTNCLALSLYRFCGCLAVLFSFYILLSPLSEQLITHICVPLTTFSLQGKYISSIFSTKSRLGNHVFELVALLGISKTIDRTPILYIENEKYSKMYEETNYLIPGLMDQFIIKNETFPKFVKITPFNLRCCVYQDPRVLESIDKNLIILSGIYYQSHKYFPEMRETMKSYLRVPERGFGDLPLSNEINYINCVHVRRGDFSRYGFHTPDADYIRKGVEYIKKKVNTKEKQLHTVLFGDDLEFMISLYTNDTDIGTEINMVKLMKTQTKYVKALQKTKSSYFISQNSPSDDLLYASHHCDSVFISAPHSTFGWWMGYFSKGDRVYYTDIRATNDSRYLTGEINPVDYYLPHWTPLRYDNFCNSTIVESET